MAKVKARRGVTVPKGDTIRGRGGWARVRGTPSKNDGAGLEGLFESLLVLSFVEGLAESFS